MLTLREITFFCLGLLAAAAVSVIVGKGLGARRKRNLFRRDFNRIALQAQARISQPDGDFVLVTGDSIVANLVLNPVPGLPVIDAAFPGITSAEFLARIGDVLKARRPRITILSIGANDALQHDANEPMRASFKQRLQQIAAVVEGAQATFVLSLPGIAATSQDFASRAAAMKILDGDVRGFAEERNWIYIDCAHVYETAAEPIAASIDGLHPSFDASRHLARALRQKIAELGNA